jgi:Emfourin
MNMLKIERIGGLAGFGLPGSRVHSSGEQSISALTPADQASVEALFQNPPPQEEQQRDAFRYRITRIVKGQKQTVEVPESAMPIALKACVSDKLFPPD